jgi:hypothetical protein
MKFTLKCPKCLNIFEFSEENEDQAICRCGWAYHIDEHLDDIHDICLNLEDEEFDIIWQQIDREIDGMRPMSGEKWIKSLQPQIPDYIKESKFSSIPQETLDSFNNLIKEMDFIRLKIYKNKASETKVGFIKVFGRKVPVYMGKYAEAVYQKHRDAIVIPYGDLNMERIKDDIQHEIGHLLDKKILNTKWQGASEKYYDVVPKQELTDREKHIYVKEPVEFDAAGTHGDYLIRNNFENSDDKSKQKIIDDLKKWLKYGDSMPFFPTDLVNIWKTKPTLYRKFQQRVYNLVQDLEDIMKSKSPNHKIS